MSHRGKKKEKRPLSSDDSDSGPDDRGPAPKGSKKESSNPYKKAETSKPVSKGSKGQEEPSWDLGKNKWVMVR